LTSTRLGSPARVETCPLITGAGEAGRRSAVWNTEPGRGRHRKGSVSRNALSWRT
jgi:hypothetical protein